MSKVKTICVVTSTRAEYGLLFWLMKAIEKSKKLKLSLVVTGTHLSKEHGNTVQFIERDGFQISEKIKILSKNGDVRGNGKTAGNAIKEFTQYFEKSKPDAVILLGDRFEILAIAQAAAIATVPVVHLHGGEISEGANDDMFRHAITKLSSLHFTSNKEHQQRVIQMGEQPAYVKLSGAFGIENIKRLKFLSKTELEKQFGMRFQKTIFLVTFHPATLEKEDPATQFSSLLTALATFKEATIFISKANADAGGSKINKMIEAISSKFPNVITSASFGQLNYLSIMKIADVVIGNSSSGILEAPSLFTSSVNIGSRQKGRACAKSVVHCSSKTKDIITAIKKAMVIKKKSAFRNPYDHGNVSVKIVTVLGKIDLTKLLPKKFYDL